jgi:hypothetical protein
MKALATIKYAISQLPEWLYGRKWVLGFITALQMGLLLQKLRAKRRELKA